MDRQLEAQATAYPIAGGAAEAPHRDVNRRHDFVLLFDVRDGNPNGDPDAGNLPRVDPETMQGLVTDVAIKRKVRDFVDLARGDEGRYKIYVQSGGEALNAKHRRAYVALDLKSTGAKQKKEDVDRARGWMCANFYDIRVFGAVMTTGVNCGQVRGPLQLTFARSFDPIVPLDVSITRVAVTREEDTEVVVGEEGGEGKGGKQTEMGRKALVPYGLYLAHGFFNPHFAGQTGLDEEDLALFWQALEKMWDHDRSSARGMMACQGLYVFSHESPLGNAPAHRLFERVRVQRRPAVEVARSFTDYSVEVDGSALPDGVTLTALVS
ncbi:MAG: type I-C CRISPR-associated protein Cas7/Csd2 [Dehalococcoidales bacterium]|nr:type I-C CRISPR-associated protein Cas7/Csd2 [Dehalococcoidales bacterium]